MFHTSAAEVETEWLQRSPTGYNEAHVPTATFTPNYAMGTVIGSFKKADYTRDKFNIGYKLELRQSLERMEFCD